MPVLDGHDQHAHAVFSAVAPGLQICLNRFVGINASLEQRPRGIDTTLPRGEEQQRYLEQIKEREEIIAEINAAVYG